MRCVKNKYPECEIHFLTKKSFSSVVASNPNISKVWTIEKEVAEIAEELKNESFDYVVDLHKNIRSKQVKAKVGSLSGTFSKLNYQKWLLTQFKVDKMPDVHIVDRYFEAVKSIDVVNDNQGLDFFIQPENEVDHQGDFVAIVVGTAHETKAMTVSKMDEIVERISIPIKLIGGPADADKAERVVAMNDDREIENCCGKYNIEQSASLLKQAKVVITPDTGMMHISAAFNKPIISVWGNTTPSFGMYPYMPKNKELVHLVEVENLKCRPCSKIGYSQCPKKHFNCIENIDSNEIESILKQYI